MKQFEEYRNKLFTVAYKMTKRVADAEDIVHDTFIAVANRQADAIHDVEGYLVRSVMNRCLTFLEKKKHIIYPGIDLPEPLFVEKFQQVQPQDISYALMVMLHTLNPLERAVFLLKETLDYGYTEVADVLSIKEDNSRQLFHRAKEKIASGKVRHTPTKEEAERIIQAFLLMCANGDTALLMSFLKEDVSIYSDGGGKVPAARNPIFGRDNCIAFLLGIYNKTGDVLTYTLTHINGEPGIVFYNKLSGGVDTAVALAFEDHAITAFYFIRNPDKLALA